MAKHSIKGKTVLIAGGAKNLGGLIARDLAEQGASAIAIHYNSDSSKADAEATVKAIQATGAQAVAFQADLRSASAMEKLFSDTVAAIGRPDIAINTVGKVLKKPLTEVSEAEYEEMSDINSKTAFFFLKEAGKHVQDNGKVCTLVTSLLGAFTPLLRRVCRHQSAGRTLHPRRRQRIWRTRYFRHGGWPWSYGYALLLSSRGGGCRSLSQDRGCPVPLLQDRADGH